MQRVCAFSLLRAGVFHLPIQRCRPQHRPHSSGPVCIGTGCCTQPETERSWWHIQGRQNLHRRRAPVWPDLEFFCKGRIHRGSMHIAQIACRFYKGNIHRNNHQSVVHNFDCVRTKLFPGQLAADDVAFKSLLIFKPLFSFVRRAEMMEKRNRDAVCRFARQEVHESFTRMPQLCAHVFILSVQYCTHGSIPLPRASFLFLPGAGRRGHHSAALRDCFTLRARARACVPAKKVPAQKPRAEWSGVVRK